MIKIIKSYVIKKTNRRKVKYCLKAKDKNTYPTLRLIVSAIKDFEIAGRSKLKEQEQKATSLVFLKKMIKQRNESCEVYKKAGRKELLENETRRESR